MRQPSNPAAQPLTRSEIVALATTLRQLRSKVSDDRDAMLAAAEAAGRTEIVLVPAYSSRSALWAVLAAAEDAVNVVLDITRAEEDRSRDAAA